MRRQKRRKGEKNGKRRMTMMGRRVKVGSRRER